MRRLHRCSTAASLATVAVLAVPVAAQAAGTFVAGPVKSMRYAITISA
jgi:hypothetical protein